MPILLLTLIVQSAFEAMIVYNIFKLNILPVKYLFVLFAILIILMVITFALVWPGMDRSPSKGRRVRRILGIVFAILVCIVSYIGSNAIEKVIDTIKAVTNVESDTEAIVGVYVLNDDPAQSVYDLEGYTVGIMTGFDEINSRIALEDVSAAVGGIMETQECPSVTELADALCSGTSGAVIINETYASLFIDTEEYATWEEDTRLIYEIEISKEEYEEYKAANNIVEEEEEEEQEETKTERVGSITTDPFIVYVSGSDTRSKILAKSRSDVNILIVVNPTTHMVLLLNTPRDYYVENPAGKGAMDKLTHLGLKGVNNTIKCLDDLYDCEVNYYCQINFTGFEKLIDSIGGVDVYSPKSFSSQNVEGYHFDKGMNHMDGAAALAFVRERYAFSDGDNERGENQMRVISAIIEKLSSGNSTVLLNYASILDSLSGMFTTNLESDEIEKLVKFQISETPSWTVVKYAVTGNGTSAKTYSMPGVYAYVMKQNSSMIATATDLIDRVEDGEVFTEDDID